MDSVSTILSPSAKSRSADLSELSVEERIVHFYEEAGQDYEHWSPGLNMHLGFYRWGMNPFDREAMLEQLNHEIAKRLQLPSVTGTFLIDLGCGMGAVSRTVAKCYPNAKIKGVTLAPSQVRIASERNKISGLEKQIEILEADYVDLPFRSGAADGVWAVESACYASGSGKEDLVAEMSRVLKAGRRFVVADCFVRDPERRFNPLIGRLYNAACRNWAVLEMAALEDFVAALKKNGFRDIEVEDVSWQAAPSLAHAPLAVMTFLLKKMWVGERIKQQSLNNLKASLLALILGMNRSKISYCLISGTRD
ncbi:MAG: methyltransferase domain-containing protein [Acidobacteriota bacterium]